ncbi:MAG TPA: LLM class flavin-dependent oxidoreductase [Ilumatobacteraceae bacterium]|nr:LLM class flavin-dependent oxidoreductase [Ilumatobacteraceae bacterium]
MDLTLHYDFRAPSFGPPVSEIYAAALEQCAWADAVGFTRVVISSHHGCDDDYGPAPLIAASAIAAVTKHMRITPVVALPLHHPLHIAEEVAVLDLVSKGRIDLMVVAGYVAAEFAMFGRRMDERGAAMEEGLASIRAAWTGEPFGFRGEQVLVRPRPYQRPGPGLIVGGDSRGAARLGDYYAAMAGGDSWPHYTEACRELGLPEPVQPRGQRAMFVHVTEDPDAAWSTLAPHLLHVNNSYAAWMTQDGRAASYEHADSVDALRSGSVFEVLTPDECVGYAREWNGLMVDPLFGGIAPDVAWASLELIRDKVLPRLAASEGSN